MTLEMKPHGNLCNAVCEYCYEEPMRLAGNTRKALGYDLDLMFAEVDKAVNKPGSSKELIVFGGESLLLKKSDLEKIFIYAKEKKLSPGIQSNGYLIDDEHLAMFVKYNVNVGISLDGPEELNDLRIIGGSLETTRQATAQTIANIERVCRYGCRIGVIFTIHKLNGTPKHIGKLLSFIRWLGDIGANSGNIHMLEVDSSMVNTLYKLTPEQNTEAFLTLARFFQDNPDLSYAPFNEMRNALVGENMKGCTFNACDSLNTQAVHGIEGNGEISNCGMTNKEGIEWNKADDRECNRTLLLFQTPPEDNGCQGCRFFSLCGGYCPGSSIDGDWRNKTIHCSSLQALFGFYEDVVAANGQEPFTRHKKIQTINQRYVDQTMVQGGVPNLKSIIHSVTACVDCN